MYARIPAPECLRGDSQDQNVADNDNPDVAIPTLTKVITVTADRNDVKEDHTVPSSSPPKHVPKHLWEKFQKLEKRTDDITRRTTERRIQHIQNDIMNKVHKEISNPDDLDILRAHDVKFGPPNEKHRKRKRKKPASTASSDTNNDVTGQIDVRTGSEPTVGFCELNQYMGVNDHLKGLDHGKHAPKTAVEERISEAVARGDIARAEQLSDHLATREFGKRVCEAIDARDYVLQKKKEDESAKARRKKKLPWRFLHKEKWETKGNM